MSVAALLRRDRLDDEPEDGEADEEDDESDVDESEDDEDVLDADDEARARPVSSREPDLAGA